jgi:hypothetical protein
MTGLDTPAFTRASVVLGLPTVRPRGTLFAFQLPLMQNQSTASVKASLQLPSQALQMPAERS